MGENLYTVTVFICYRPLLISFMGLDASGIEYDIIAHKVRASLTRELNLKNAGFWFLPKKVLEITHLSAPFGGNRRSQILTKNPQMQVIRIKVTPY
jgi:hypothetical protein